MPKHTCEEWNLILAAYIYECTDEKDQFMSDQSYDRISNEFKTKGCTIPGFDPNSGQWIHTLFSNPEYKRIITSAYCYWKRYNNVGKGEGITPHCLINSEFISDDNTYSTKPGDYL
jgi:hypothetical protein